MSLYKRDSAAAARVLTQFEPEERPLIEFKFALTDMLTGPMSAHRAADVVDSLLRTSTPNEIADTMTNIAARWAGRRL